MKSKAKIIFLLMWIPFLGIAQIDTNRVINEFLNCCVNSYDPAGLVMFKYDTLQPGDALLLFKEITEDESHDLHLMRSDFDTLTEYTFLRYQETYLGIPLEGAEVIEHEKDGFIHALNGKVAFLDRSLEDTISKAQAHSILDTAGPWSGYEEWAWENEEMELELQSEFNNEDTSYLPLLNAKLVWALESTRNLGFLIPDTLYRLAWKFEVLCLNPYFVKTFYVDANSGELFKERSRVCQGGTAIDPTYGEINIDTKQRWPQGDYVLETNDNGRRIETRYFEPLDEQSFSSLAKITHDDNEWDDVEVIGTSVHWMASESWDYFSQTFGYKGMKNNNSHKVKVRVTDLHYNRVASYDESTDNLRFGNFHEDHYGVIDFVGHEFTHGINNYTAELFYEDEPGALSESFSDIFGTMVERWAGEGNDDWTLAEDAVVQRSMSDPTSSGQFWTNDNQVPCEAAWSVGQPDTYQGWHWFTGDCDYGGVHCNSGVQNKWFHLLSEGGTLNGIQVIGIGADDAAKIAFQTLRFNLTSTSGYNIARAMSIYNAMTLFQACSQEYISTIRAWNAVMVPGFTPPCANGVDEVAHEEMFKVFPNPSNGALTIINTDGRPINKFEISTMTGQLIYINTQVSSKREEIMLNLNAGIYILKMFTGDNFESQRIIIQ